MSAADVAPALRALAAKRELFTKAEILDAIERAEAWDLPRIESQAQAGKVALAWRADGYPAHGFAGLPHEESCRRCTGGRDGIQHRDLPEVMTVVPKEEGEPQ